MLGVILIIVGIVLFHNGVTALLGSNAKTVAVINFTAAALLFVIHIITLSRGGGYADAGLGLLFPITYLWIGFNAVYDLDTRPFGWFALFVAVVAVPTGIAASTGADGDWRIGFLWFFWAVVWFAVFLGDALKLRLGKIPALLLISSGILTGWLPGYLMLSGWW